MTKLNNDDILRTVSGFEQKIVEILRNDSSKRGPCLAALAAQRFEWDGVEPSVEDILQYLRTHRGELNAYLNQLLRPA